MKKVILGLLLVSSICACESISQYMPTGTDSAKAKMHTCLVNEATTKYQAGTLFTQGITETAKGLVGTCVKKLALQSAGISEESQTMATAIIQNLQNFGSAQ